MRSMRSTDFSADPVLVDVLITAVKESMDAGRPLDGTRLGHVLGDAYRQRGMPTGPGAYRPVTETAVRERRLKKVWNPQRTRMALILGEQEVPSGWIEDGPSAGPPGAVRGLPADTEYLRWELFEAFSGRRASVSLDLNEPPNVRVVASGPPYPLVTPLQPEAVVQAWTTFAAENMLDEATTGEVVKMIGSTPATAWGRIEVPGDNAVRRLGSRFHRARLGLLVDHARKWFANNGKNPADYELFSRRPKTARATGSLPRYSIAEGNPSSHRQTLRERLKRIIDVMSTEQLYELRIPAEFLDT